jgi:hypothetical protein
MFVHLLATDELTHDTAVRIARRCRNLVEALVQETDLPEVENQFYLLARQELEASKASQNETQPINGACDKYKPSTNGDATNLEQLVLPHARATTLEVNSSPPRQTRANLANMRSFPTDSPPNTHKPTTSANLKESRYASLFPSHLKVPS